MIDKPYPPVLAKAREETLTTEISTAHLPWDCSVIPAEPTVSQPVKRDILAKYLPLSQPLRLCQLLNKCHLTQNNKRKNISISITSTADQFEQYRVFQVQNMIASYYQQLSEGYSQLAVAIPKLAWGEMANALEHLPSAPPQVPMTSPAHTVLNTKLPSSSPSSKPLSSSTPSPNVLLLSHQLCNHHDHNHWMSPCHQWYSR